MHNSGKFFLVSCLEYYFEKVLGYEYLLAVVGKIKPKMQCKAEKYLRHFVLTKVFKNRSAKKIIVL